MAAPALTRQMAGLLENIRRAKRPPFRSMSPLQARRSYEAAAEILDFPRAALARVEEIRLPGGDGKPLAARLYAASSDVLPGRIQPVVATPGC